ncbi:hypothetical protein RHMOL_Rhmol12G0095400 [Rhododendron molle]|uniref:Uncharacterized protein n=1 Tax=Rhododendron molle TaxID=49168 RepID=A0ACC0LH55_RHOML|nr:hypothetical protein RHMOL_Rhmol12G0095400 [Rhododendron molle]
MTPIPKSPFPSPTTAAAASMKATNFAILTIALSLFFSPSSAKTLKDRLFPTIEVTLSNESGNNIYHLCNFNSSQKSFNLLPKGEKVSWQFRQHLFPTRWCYLYLNDEKHGFFWAYTVRLKCKECAWRITNGPYIYRRRDKIWELAYLHPIPGTSFDPDGR